MSPIRTKDALDRAESKFRKQEQVTRERNAIWAEYVASYHAIDAKTARLRSVRLAKVAADGSSAANDGVPVMNRRS